MISISCMQRLTQSWSFRWHWKVRRGVWDMEHCSFLSSTPLLARDLCILAERITSKLQCYSDLTLPHLAPKLLTHQQHRKDPAVRTKRWSYKTTWSADKMRDTEEARDRGTSDIIKNCQKPPHHLRALSICLLPSPFLQTLSRCIHPSEIQLLSFSKARFLPAITTLYSQGLNASPAPLGFPYTLSTYF